LVNVIACYSLVVVDGFYVLTAKFVGSCRRRVVGSVCWPSC
jgi:hypothetical protein